MFGSPALDVAFGLALAYLLFALAASKINETIASLLSLRHKGLEKALVALLGSDADGMSANAVLGHDLVTGLQVAASSDRGQRMRHMLGIPPRGISYLPSRTFSAFWHRRTCRTPSLAMILCSRHWPRSRPLTRPIRPASR